LDLLVFLVKQKKVDIKSIPISVLADEFIDYMQKMERLDINLSSDFMVTASYLMKLKSKALLPRISEEEKKMLEDEKERLYELIEAYARVKEMVRSIERKEIKPRFPVRISRTFGKMDFRMVKAIKAVVDGMKVREKVYRIKAESLSVEEMMEKLLNEDYPQSIEEILSKAKTRYELVIILLAILELIRLGKLVYERGMVLLP